MTQEVVQEVIEGRRSVYGDPEETFIEHAKVWSVIFKTEVRPDQVALALIAYKLLRANHTPDYSDNIDDVIGYADIFKKVQGDRMIDARSVDDYLRQKAGREQLTRLGLVGNLSPAERYDYIFGQGKAALLSDNQVRAQLAVYDENHSPQHLPDFGCCDAQHD